MGDEVVERRDTQTRRREPKRTNPPLAFFDEPRIVTMLLTRTLLLSSVVLAFPLSVVQAKGTASLTAAEGEAGRTVVAYAEALAHSKVQAWASYDLGCAIRPRGKQASLAAEAASQCWNDTLAAHRDLVAQKAEEGVFDAVGRGAGFGLLHERHRASENWKDYPPALFLSPPIVRREGGVTPEITWLHTGPLQSVAVVGLKGQELTSLKGQAVDLKVVYRDPVSAPLALRPEEVWWVTGAQRRFGPVREVHLRFILLSGLRKLGYPVDRAVMNEALPGAPLIATTHYGLRPDAGRRADDQRSENLIKGELLPGTARWWEPDAAKAQVHAAVDRASRLSSAERSDLLTRLLLLDPTNVQVNALRGDDAYEEFLKQGIAKGRLAAREERTLSEMAELYWTVQAQTWRQELTAVSAGYEPAADALYRASAAYDTLVQQGQATVEQRRRLGSLTRWNNDPGAALAIHEPLLKDAAADQTLQGRLLADIAWDRLQWVSWERRYDHPWLQQAAEEANQAAAKAQRPEQALTANYALVVVESLRVPRNQDAFTAALDRAKQDLAKVPDTKGLHDHLIANDLVKALTPEATRVVLPTPPRSSEVLDTAIHANAPRQDIVWLWNFDKDKPSGLPAGFTPMTQGSTESSEWSVQVDPDQPAAQFVTQTRPCSAADCAHLLVVDRIQTTYPDLTVMVQDLSKDGKGEAGLVVAVLDNQNYYAVTLQPSTGLLTTRRVTNGVTTVLGQQTLKLTSRPWHTIRVQRINFIHLDKGRLGVFVDGAQIAAVDDAVLPKEGRVGLITIGATAAKFDGLHLIDLVSNTTFSKPAAY